MPKGFYTTEEVFDAAKKFFGGVRVLEGSFGLACSPSSPDTIGFPGQGKSRSSIGETVSSAGNVGLGVLRLVAQGIIHAE